jgi:hypothetical protein
MGLDQDTLAKVVITVCQDEGVGIDAIITNFSKALI